MLSALSSVWVKPRPVARFAAQQVAPESKAVEAPAERSRVATALKVTALMAMVGVATVSYVGLFRAFMDVVWSVRDPEVFYTPTRWEQYK